MIGVTLWREGDEQSGISLVYLGDAVVYEYNYKGRSSPHYFETKSESIEFIIKSAYALLSTGYKVFEEEVNSN